MHEMQPIVINVPCLSVTNAPNDPHGESDLRLLHCVGSFSAAFDKLLWPLVTIVINIVNTPYFYKPRMEKTERKNKIEK